MTLSEYVTLHGEVHDGKAEPFISRHILNEGSRGESEKLTGEMHVGAGARAPALDDTTFHDAVQIDTHCSEEIDGRTCLNRGDMS